jgi:hypothetical protein
VGITHEEKNVIAGRRKAERRKGDRRKNIKAAKKRMGMERRVSERRGVDDQPKKSFLDRT